MRRLHQGIGDTSRGSVADRHQALALVAGAPATVMLGNGLAGKDAPAALGGALPGLEPAEEAARLGIDREAVVAGLALQPRPGVEHVQPAEEDLVMGGDRLGGTGGIGRDRKSVV